jgi:phosphoesterase RecJ-like protein
MGTITTEPGVALARLIRARRVLVTSHMSPDGDALGSELALAELAEGLGITAMVANRDPAPASLCSLPGAERIHISSSLPEDFPESYDLVVTLECPGLDRPGFDSLDRIAILNIDHHQGNQAYGEINYIDPEAPAVGEMIWQMFHESNIKPTPAAATNMYLALSTDTGDFRYSNATGRAFRAAAEMVEAGASPVQTAEWVHGQRSEASVRLVGEALKTLTLHCGGGLATMSIDTQAYERANASPADTDQVIDLPRSIAGVRAVAFFKQWEPGIVRVSLRSKGTVDVCRVAARFGGGGHKNASGCTIHGELSTAVQDLVPILALELEAAS